MKNTKSYQKMKAMYISLEDWLVINISIWIKLFLMLWNIMTNILKNNCQIKMKMKENNDYFIF